MKGDTISTDNTEPEEKGIVLLSDTVITPSPATSKERHEPILKKSDVNQQETIEEEDLIILEDTDEDHPLIVSPSDNSFSILDSWKYSDSNLLQEESTKDTSIHQMDQPINEEEDYVPEVKKPEPVRKSKRIRKPPVRFAQVNDMPEDPQKTLIDVMLSLPIGEFPTEECFQYIPITPEGNPILGLSSQNLL